MQQSLGWSMLPSFSASTATLTEDTLLVSKSVTRPSNFSSSPLRHNRNDSSGFHLGISSFSEASTLVSASASTSAPTVSLLSLAA